MLQLFFLCAGAWGCTGAVSKARGESAGERRALAGEGEVEDAANGKNEYEDDANRFSTRAGFAGVLMYGQRIYAIRHCEQISWHTLQEIGGLFFFIRQIESIG